MGKIVHFGIRKKLRKVLMYIWGTKVDEKYWANLYVETS